MKRFSATTAATLLLAVFMIALSSSRVNGQVITDKKLLKGAWMGRLESNGMYLRLVFNISVNEQDSLKASLESPDQGSMIIPLGRVKLSGDSLTIEAAVIGGRYRGVINSLNKIVGEWEQAGRIFPLSLEKQEKQETVVKINRPQEPRPPFPYKEEEVSFRNEKGSITLTGTLTLPEGDGPFPAAILITGSGAQNRDEELMGHKPFAVIADHLTRNGIAVLRYDDRGTGKSQGVYATATTADLATDAGAALLYLQTRGEIIPGKIGLIGHSEGGLIAPVLASAQPAVAYIVSLAGPGVTGEEVLHKQNEDISKAMGSSDTTIASGIKINKRLYSIVRKNSDNVVAEAKVMKEYGKQLRKLDVPEEVINERVTSLRLTFGAPVYTWFRYFLITDPADFWTSVKCPVLILNGAKDLQVSASVNTAAIAGALTKGGNNSHKIIIYPGLNHLFQNCETGLPGEYGTIEETMSAEVLATMAVWIRENTMK
jgi:uncharacterized protein